MTRRGADWRRGIVIAMQPAVRSGHDRD